MWIPNACTSSALRSAAPRPSFHAAIIQIRRVSARGDRWRGMGRLVRYIAGVGNRDLCAPPVCFALLALPDSEAIPSMGMMRVKIPHTNLDGGCADMRSRLQTWTWFDRLKPDQEEVILDFTENEFIEPWALVQFLAYALWMRLEHNVPVRAELDPLNPANKYVRSMGIKHVLETGESTTEWDESAQNTGVHVLRTHAEVKRFVDSVTRLGGTPNRDTMDALKYGMAELGRNVIQHAASPIGGVAMAQFFPDRRAVQVSICDRGRGLWESLKSNYPELRSDLEAAKLSVLPHVSGAPEPGPYGSPDNAGLGLFFCKEIAWRVGGSFWLASRTALLGVRGDDQAGQHRIYRRINRWDGTSVSMDFPADSTKDFADLLQVCQNLARTARSSSAEAGLDFLDELPEEFDGEHVLIEPIAENNEKAAELRRDILLPSVREGRWVVLDFENVRFATQSFIHALLNEPLRTRESVLRLSFLKCTRATREAIHTVAAYSSSARRLS